MSAANKAWIAILLCFAALQLSCVSLPPQHAKGDASLQFPGLRCSDASGLRFYFTGDTFLSRAEELIRGARDYILIDSFVTVDDEKGKRVFSLLRQRMAEGLRVYVITDSCSGFVSGFVDGRTAVPYLVEIGIPVVEFNPIRVNRTARLPIFEYRDHRKFWLVDGETVVLGGQNIWSISLNPPEEGGTVDAMVEFRSGSAVAELLAGFVQEWNAYSMEKLDRGDFAVRRQPAGSTPLWLVHQDRFTKPLIGEMFDRLLGAAEREVWLIQSYTLPDRTLLSRIRSLSAEGVTVNILFSTAYRTMDKFFYATGYRMLDLIEAGAVLWEYEHPLSHLHYKGVIVDGRWFAVGSANLNYRSCHLSKELNIAFEGSDLGAPMLDQLSDLVAGSRRVSKLQASQRRGFKFLAYYLFLYFGG